MLIRGRGLCGLGGLCGRLGGGLRGGCGGGFGGLLVLGGVLDVVDAIIYSAPVSYLWLYLLKTS